MRKIKIFRYIIMSKSINLSKPKSNDDEFYTPLYALEMLKPYLPSSGKVWEIEQ